MGDKYMLFLKNGSGATTSRPKKLLGEVVQEPLTERESTVPSVQIPGGGRKDLIPSLIYESFQIADCKFEI